jgi:hypothetical protein
VTVTPQTPGLDPNLTFTGGTAYAVAGGDPIRPYAASLTGVADTRVTWSVDSVPGGNAASGLIGADGTYLAGAGTSAGAHVVTATSVAFPSLSGSNNLFVFAKAAIQSFTASPSQPRHGEPVALTAVYPTGSDWYHQMDATVDQGIGAVASGTPVTTGPVTAATTYTLTVQNIVMGPNNLASRSVTVTPQTVTVGAITSTVGGAAAPVQSVTAGVPVTLSAAVTGGYLGTVSWSSAGAGSWSGSVWTPPATPQTVTLTATSVDDPSVSSTATVSVLAVPSAALAASTATPLFGAPFTLTPTYAGGTGALDFGVTCPPSLGSANLVADWSGPRTYTLTVTSPVGALATATVTVTPQTVSVGAISPAAPVPTTGAVTAFSAPVTGGYLGTVTWSATAGAIDPATGAWTAPAAAGPVTITATSVDDPSKSVSTTATVYPAAVVTRFAASTGTPRSGDPVVLTVAFPAGTTGVVDPDIGPVVSGGSYATPAITAPRTYTLTVTGAPGQTSAASITLTPQGIALVGTGPAAPAVTVGQSVAFTGAVAGAADGTVLWSATAGSWSGSVWTAPATPGPVTVTAAAEADPAVTWTTTVAVLAAVPTPQLTVPLAVVTGHGGYAASVPLQADGTTYQWALAGATLDSGQGQNVIRFTVTAPEGGQVSVACTVSSPSGDARTAVQTLAVQGVAVILPGYLELLPGARQVIHATTSDGAGVSWALDNADAGTLLQATRDSVVLQAPAAPGPWQLIATSLSDPSRSAILTFGVLNTATGPSGTVGLDNLADLLDEYGGPDPSVDLSGDGKVDDPDLAMLLDTLFGGGS